jgi:hypothetical protein
LDGRYDIEEPGSKSTSVIRILADAEAFQTGTRDEINRQGNLLEITPSAMEIRDN